MIDGWTDLSARALLGAMQAVAEQNPGGPTNAQKQLVQGAARHVFGIDRGDESAPSTSPGELAAALEDPEQRELATQFLVLVPYGDTSLAAETVAAADAYAAALGTDDHTLKDLHRARDHQLKRLVLDYTRRATGELYGHGRIKAIFSELHQYVGDADMARRYEALESFPEGSLGHAFFVFYRDRVFPLPGEKKSLGEVLVHHDCCHILSGFNTDGTGEINVAGFEAGMKRNDFGFELLMEVLLDFQLGLSFGAKGLGFVVKTGELDPDRLMVGIDRGLGCNTDVLAPEWDFWAAADREVVELREHYGIEGATGVIIPPPEHPATST